MKKLLLCVAVMMLLGIAYPVEAQTNNGAIRVSWELPTTDQDICAGANPIIDACIMTQALCEANGGIFTPASALTVPLSHINLKWGTVSGTYPNVINVGLVTEYRLTNLPDDTDIYFIQSAVNTLGNESCNSKELSVKTLTTPGCKAPVNLGGVAE